MTNIMYIKSPDKTDYYIANKNFMNIVSISQDHLYVMAEDEGMGAEGAYKIIKIDKRTFEKMKNFAIDKKRKELTDILKKVHNKNKDILENSPLQLRMERLSNLIIERSFIDHYNKSEPILD